MFTDSVSFIGDLKFKCTDFCAIVNNKRHMIMCKVYDTGGISCNTILWKRGDTGEDYTPGSYNNINVSCKVSQVNMIFNSGSCSNINVA